MTTNDATPREADRAVPEPDADAAGRKVHSLARSCLSAAYEMGRREGERNEYGTDAGRKMDSMAGKIAAAVREAMLSEDVLEELNSAVELETINVHSGEFRVNAHEMMNAALNMAGLTEREE